MGSSGQLEEKGFYLWGFTFEFEENWDSSYFSVFGASLVSGFLLIIRLTGGSQPHWLQQAELPLLRQVAVGLGQVSCKRRVPQCTSRMLNCKERDELCCKLIRQRKWESESQKLMFKARCKHPRNMLHFSFLFWILSKPGLFSQTDPLTIVIIFFLLFVLMFLELHNLKFNVTVQLRCSPVPPAKEHLSAILCTSRKTSQISVQSKARNAAV